MVVHRLFALSGATLIALGSSASAGSVVVAARDVIAPASQIETAASKSKARKPARHTAHKRYYRSYGSNSGAAAAFGLAAGALALGAAAAGAGDCGYYGCGYGYYGDGPYYGSGYYGRPYYGYRQGYHGWRGGYAGYNGGLRTGRSVGYARPGGFHR